MTEDDFRRLREHLVAVDPILNTFCAANGFAQQTTGIGHYPRRRIWRSGDVILNFDLEMDFDDRGQHFTQFDPNLPYSLWCGASYDRGHEHFYRGHFVFKQIPFTQVCEILAQSLDSGLAIIAAATPESLITTGKKSILSGVAK